MAWYPLHCYANKVLDLLISRSSSCIVFVSLQMKYFVTCEFGECINRIAPPSPARALTLKTSTRMKTRIFYETIKLFYPIVNNTFTVAVRQLAVEWQDVTGTPILPGVRTQLLEQFKPVNQN
ncbi:hypothetical protein OUZ56_005488 [Daphnia magna]|uniref:Uncharacterized protein n=1 Tax=Daphnia magna TaxID=35525 RepID=A0ABQ9YSY0_9CRUS|nr:hypothetical protein OUZ56_005488 [Daphnia magna]